MDLTDDYSAIIVELVESSENALNDGHYEEAWELMEEVRDTATLCLEELERFEFEGEDE
jgi:hypothetical protein